MISFRARIIKKLLKFSVGNKKYDYDYILKIRKIYDKSLNSDSFLSKRVKLDWFSIEGVRVAWISPRQSPVRTIVYTHGGGFVFGLSSIHVSYLVRLSNICNARILVIDYKLSPENKYPFALNEILMVWRNLVSGGLDASKTVFMGDSAGANLALATSLKLRDDDFIQPACLVLACPSLDETFSGQSYLDNKSKDPVLNQDKINYFIDSYIGNSDRCDPFISPIFAKLNNLPPILIHVGTEEILLSDSITFAENAKRDHADVTLFIGDGMWHNWHLSKNLMPESKRAIKAVAKYIISKTSI